MQLLDLVVLGIPHALRRLVKAPSFATVSVVTLALAIGSNAAVFTLIDQLLFRPLPVKAPDTLVLVSASPLPRFGHEGSVGWSDRRPDGRMAQGISLQLSSTLAERVPAFAESFAQYTLHVPGPGR